MKILALTPTELRKGSIKFLTQIVEFTIDDTKVVIEIDISQIGQQVPITVIADNPIRAFKLNGI